MTNTQLYIAICVPTLAMIFAMVTNFALISRVDKRIDDLKDVLRAEMQRDHSEVMSKFADVERRLERLEGERRVIQ